MSGRRRNVTQAAFLLIFVLYTTLIPQAGFGDDPPPPAHVGTDDGEGYEAYAEENRSIDPGAAGPPAQGTTDAPADTPTAEQIDDWLRGVRDCMTDSRAEARAAGLPWTISGARDTCEGSPEAASPAEPAQQVTTDLVYTELKKIPLPTPELVMQPPDGLGLVNFPHIFYSTTPPPQPITVTLLGRPVVLTLTATYEWHVAPGVTLTTNHPGAPYPDETITHTYTDTGTVEVSLTITYGGTFTVDGGPPQPINGTVPKQSNPISLQIISAHPELVEGP